MTITFSLNSIPLNVLMVLKMTKNKDFQVGTLSNWMQMHWEVRKGHH